ncbi:MAG: hypothetical protein CMG46_03865 [Candidatus Marinimicrobia bacterium]|nr:hypothetical protein [Candidatus Neomarinimicrobiota bacterium]|tara:strand:+ start:25 stop:414 length:390 start_codon:yes stop_codon:yes gene_type:complete
MNSGYRYSWLSSFIILMVGLHSTTASATDGSNIGDTQMCINSEHIIDTPVIDRKTILVKMLIPKDGYKRIDLVRNCSGLYEGNGFSYDTSLNKLCKQDLLFANGSAGSACLIDQIVTIDKAEARRLIEK